MAKASFDLSGRGFDRRNLYLPRSEVLEVRPGLREVLTPRSGYEFVGGTTVKSPSSLELCHYLVSYYEAGLTSQTAGVLVECYDEELDRVQSLEVPASIRPRGISFAKFGYEMLITADGMEPVHALLGGHLRLASKKDSRNPALTSIDIPQGISVGWASRVVVAARSGGGGSGLYISEPERPEAFVTNNIILGPWASPVFGLHVALDGALIVVTESGVWAIPEEAAVNQRVLGDISLVTEEGVFDYNQSCAHGGAVWSVTRRGVTKLYPGLEREIDINERRIPRSLGAAFVSDDFRLGGRLINSYCGPLLSYEGGAHRLDLKAGDKGWWTTPHSSSFEVVGTLRDEHGEEMWIDSDGVYRLVGNFEGGETDKDELNTSVVGFLAGLLPNDPKAAFAASHVKFKADGPGESYLGLNGETHTVDIPQTGMVEGVAAWTDTADIETPQLEQVTSGVTRDRGERREVSIEVGAEHPGTRIMPSVDVEMGGSGHKHDNRRA